MFGFFESEELKKYKQECRDLRNELSDAYESNLYISQAKNEALAAMEKMKTYRDEEKLDTISTEVAKQIENMFVGNRFSNRLQRLGAIQLAIKEALLLQLTGTKDWNPKPSKNLE